MFSPAFQQSSFRGASEASESGIQEPHGVLLWIPDRRYAASGMNLRVT
jgi:hypothetical protein